MSDTDGALFTAVLVLLLIMANGWNHDYGDQNGPFINSDGEVPDCTFASVKVLDKWFIESNYTFVLNTTTIVGFHDQEQMVAHVIVTKGMFEATNVSDVHEGWICSTERIAIMDLIANNVIRIVDGNIIF